MQISGIEIAITVSNLHRSLDLLAPNLQHMIPIIQRLADRIKHPILSAHFQTLHTFPPIQSILRIRKLHAHHISLDPSLLCLRTIAIHAAESIIPIQRQIGKPPSDRSLVARMHLIPFVRTGQIVRNHYAAVDNLTCSLMLGIADYGSRVVVTILSRVLTTVFFMSFIR